jgi:arsenate reductase
MEATIYHNPRCGHSRGALALLRERGIEPAIVDYLGHPLDVTALRNLVARVGVPLRELLRTKEAVYAELDLGHPSRTEDELYEAVARHPILLNRPIVVTPKGALLCRPPERVLELL